MKITEILNRDPDKLLAMTQDELKEELSSFFPKVRTPILPEETPKKMGVDKRMIKDALAATKRDIEELLKMKGLTK